MSLPFLTTFLGSFSKNSSFDIGLSAFSSALLRSFYFSLRLGVENLLGFVEHLQQSAVGVGVLELVGEVAVPECQP